MAYSAFNINPADLKRSTALGVSIPFSARSVFTSVYTTKEQLKYNIINYLLTSKGERVFEPNFGSGIRNFLFEQITPESIENLKSIIKLGIEDYFNNVEVTELNINSDSEDNRLYVEFKYKILNLHDEDEVVLSIDIN